MKKVKLFFLLLVLTGSYIHAQGNATPLPSILQESPVCVNSTLLPGVMIDTLFTDCFAPDIATTLASHPDKLKKYLNQYPLTEITAPFHYWYELREEHLLNAFLLSMTMVNQSKSAVVVKRYQKDADFLFTKALAHIEVEKSSGFIQLLTHRKVLNYKLLEPLFLLTLDGVVKKSISSSSHSSEYYLSFALYQLIARLEKENFICSKGIGCEIIQAMVKAYKQKLFISLLDAYLFVMKKGGEFPRFTIWSEDLRNIISLKQDKEAFADKGDKSPENLLSQVAISQIYRIPKIKLKNADQLKDSGLHGEATPLECAYLNERSVTFQGDSMREAWKYNKVLQFLSGCTSFVPIPFSFQENRIEIDKEQKWVIDIALMMQLAMTTPNVVKDRDSLLLAALFSSARKYAKQRTGHPFGEALLYALYTRKLPLFLDMHFLAPAGMLSDEEMSKAVDAVESFY